MTLRAKPAVKRGHRPSWETDTRRTLYLNIGFGLVVLVALLLLAGAAGASWYNDHLAPVAHVNGVTISKDDVKNRITLDTFRINYLESQITQRQNQGLVSASDAQTQVQTLEQSKQQISSGVLGELVDQLLEGQIAPSQGVKVTDQQLQTAMTQQASIPEYRHVWVIAIKPNLPSSQTTGATAAQKATAKSRAETLLGLLKGGLDFSAVAKENSSDVSASSGGDLGFVTSEDTSMDPALAKALFALTAPGYTGVVEGANSTYFFGRVTQISPLQTDASFDQKVSQAGISLDYYKAAVRSSLVHNALRTAVLDRLTKQSSVQRHVLEIYLAAPGQGAGPGDEVHSRHILFSPKQDPTGAAQGKYKADGPEWAKAKADAEAAYQELTTGKADFASLAKKDSADTGTASSGGDLGWLTESQLTTNFAKAIFAEGLTPGQILAPVKTEYGWHVIQILGRRAPAQSRIQVYAAELKAGTDFATLAKEKSEGAEASKGGDIGWVAPYQLSSDLEKAIFAAKVGQVSDVLAASDGSYYLFKVLAQETRPPDAGQVTALDNSGYDNWYSAQKAKATITYEPAAANYGQPAAS